MRIDESVPYVALRMERPAEAPAFHADMPDGYSIAKYSPGDEHAWAHIVTATGEFTAQEKALAFFEEKFVPYAQLLKERCLFAVNPQGEKVGTLTAWQGDDGTSGLPRVHWVSVVPDEQGKGLAKALVAESLAFFAMTYPGQTVYLTTQTWSHAAINLYEKAGFAIAGEDRKERERALYILDCIRKGGGTMTTEEKLNQPYAKDRLKALAELDKNALPPLSDIYVNNHIHTTYSFSPYSPTCALYRARLAGLPTAGIMDHDSVSGAEEFAKAGEILGVATTTGLECRVSLAGTPFADRSVNNPDQRGNAYLAMHGIPRQSLSMITQWLEPIREARGRRNRAMVEKLNGILAKVGISLDYDRDVVPLSQWKNGGSVTERHICSAAAYALIETHSEDLLGVLGTLGTHPKERLAEYLSDQDNPFRMYDLIGVFKSDLISEFYLPPTEECPPIADFVKLCHEAGAIAAYPYLGDVGDSVTGDKKTQAFEDAFLDELFAVLKEMGFDAITYMPSRNTAQQLARVRALCKQHGFFEISGEDINQPRQSFLCPALERPEFAHLRTATWALIGHERAATTTIEEGMFSEKTIRETPDLEQRVKKFAGK